MCYWYKLADGTVVHINAHGSKQKYCDCGHVADFLCDWKMIGKSSGTCDGPICKKCALRVGEDKHLCRFHQKAYEQWKRRHPAAVVEPPKQLSLLER